MTVAAVVLAAGCGARWRGPGSKLAAPYGEGTVLGRAVAGARASGVAEVVVVVGDRPYADLLPDDVVVVVNPSWRDGMASSLQAGLGHAARAGHAAVVVGLGDQPNLAAEAWRRVAATDAPVAVATYAGRRGHPVRLAAEVWPLLPTTGDEGARRLLADHPDLVREIPCPGDPADIDTEEDLRRWS